MLHPMAEYSSTPKWVLEYPLSTPTRGQPTALPPMAAGPPGRLMRPHKLHGELPVYFGDMDNQKDAEFAASDSESSSAASSVASSKEEHLREVEDAAAKVRT